jgi:hypothetical protein
VLHRSVESAQVQRSVALQDNEWQVSAEAVVEPQSLTGCTQSED